MTSLAQQRAREHAWNLFMVSGALKAFTTHQWPEGLDVTPVLAELEKLLQALRTTGHQ